MASEYAYADLAGVENYTGLDYSSIDATALSDTKVDAKITMAEKIINGFLGEDSDITITDGMEVATIIIAAQLIHQAMNQMGYFIDIQAPLFELPVKEILKLFCNWDSQVGVDTVPMSGADM